MKKISKTFMIFIVVCLAATNLYAQSDEYFDLDFEDDSSSSFSGELKWVTGTTKVVTASMVEEEIQEASANITVLTDYDIEKLGVNTLYEALSFVPGIIVRESFFGYTEVIFRGNTQSNYNNKSLLLINGHPSWEVVNGSYHLEMIPIDSIKQIEIIRGPGSVLYGTNAFAGVINVITKSGKEQENLKVSAKGGSFATKETRLTYGKGDKDFDILFSASIYDNDGYDFKIDQDESGNPGEVEYENDVTNFFGSLRYKDLTVNMGWFDQTKQKVGLTPNFLLGGESSYESYYTSLSYSNKINDSNELTFNLYYDAMERDIEVGLLDGGVNALPEGTKSGAKLLWSHILSKKFDFTLGTTFDRYEAEPYYFKRMSDGGVNEGLSAWITDLETDEVSVFSQANIRPTDALKFVLGVRYNDNDKAGDDTSPNLGMVYKFSDNTFFKVLYGVAFRSPNFFEQSVDTAGVLAGKEDLKNETIDTLDIGLDLTFAKKHFLKLNLFHLETEDTILRSDANLDGIPDFINGEGHEVQGLEIDFSSRPSDSFSWFVNMSYQDGELSDSGLDIAFMPEITANAGIDFQVTNKSNLYTNLQYIGEQEDNDSYNSIDAYTLVNVQYVFRLTDNLKLLLTANNIFDEEYTYPEYIRQNIDDIGNGPEASYYAKLEAVF